METSLDIFTGLLFLLIALYGAKIILYVVLRCTTKHTSAANLPCAETFRPSVEVFVPMYNEEKVIKKTLEALLRSTYPVQIRLVDDGSTDNTVNIVAPYLEIYNHVHLTRQRNAGKSVALNRAIVTSESDIVVCMDADTLIAPDTVNCLIKRFRGPEVAAVSGNLRASNLSNWLTVNQDIEYICISNYEREIFERINGIVILPGAIGAFRRSVLVELGGYDRNCLTEDIDMALRIKERGYVIRDAKEAIGYTEVPQTLTMYLRQRVRWRMGILQVTFRYLRSRVNNWRLYAAVIPYMLLFRISLPFLTPWIDYYMLYALFQQGITSRYILLYFCFILLDSFICVYILLKKKHIKYACMAPFQRFGLRQLGLLVNADMLYRLCKGELFEWRRCERYGTDKTIL